MSEMLPYPGLRPFSNEEAVIFFGREEHVDHLLSKLETTRFLSIIGPSGCGKSSLIRAGLIPALHSGFISSAGVSWSVLTMRPGANPLKSLSSALLEYNCSGCSKDENAETFIYSMLSRGPLGLVEVLQEKRFRKKQNLLLLVDQFEELFRISTKRSKEDAEEFVLMLLESSKQTEIPIYIVITMRTDYLGECAQFQGLPEAINEGQYLTPRLTRDQRKDAITGPASVFDGEIDPKLLNQIINDMGTDPDQLPLMQHVLRRMWINACKENRSDKIILTIEDYEKVGCLSRGLSIHAEEIMSQLTQKQAQMAEIMFRNLCELDCGSDGRYVRRPLTLNKICEIGGVDKQNIIPVIDKFRHYDCSFLNPLSNEPLKDNSIIDLSHESLIRQWPRLKQWVDKEAESAEIYRLLLQNAILWEKKQGALYGTPNLEIALNKKEKENWTAQWSQRYGGRFELTGLFLEKSIQKHNEEEERKRFRQQELEKAQALAEQERRNAELDRKITIGTGGTLLFTLTVIILFYFAFVIESSTSYNSWIKRFGLPVGIGKLTKQQVVSRSESYRIIKKGFWGPVIRFEVIGSNGKLKESENVSTYLQDYSGKKAERISVVRYTIDKKRVVSEMAYNRRGQLLWGLVYFPVSPLGDLKKQVIATYVGKDGLPKAIGKSTASSVRLSYSENGDEIKVEYLDSRGDPQPGVYGSYGLECSYDKNGKCVEMISIDAKGKLMNDDRGFSICKMKYSPNGNVIEKKLFGANRKQTLCNEGYHKWVSTYDNNGNQIEERIYNHLDKPTYNKNGYHICRQKFDQKGKLISKSYFDSDEKPVFIKGGYHENRFSYDSYDNVNEHSYFGFNNQVVLCSELYHAQKILYDTLGRELQWNYYGLTKEPCEFKDDYYHCCRFVYDERGDLVKLSYYDLYSNSTEAEDNWSSKVMLYDNRHNLVQIKYLDKNGKPVICKRGFSIVQYNLDDRGNIIKEQYYGVDSWLKPVNCIEGYQTRTSEYDGRGHLKTISFFDESGRKAIDSLYGCHLVELACDEKGNDTLLIYWGNDGKLVMADGVNKVRIKYDEHNNWTTKEFYNIQDIPVNLSSGYQKECAEWNVLQNRIEWRYYDKEGKRVNGKEGYHRKHCDYDEIGNLTSIAYFDSLNRQFICSLGYQRVAFTYNRSGQIESYSFYGPDSIPFAQNGFHKVVKRYNNRGQIESVSYYDTLLRNVLCKEGYHSIKYGYDMNGYFEWISYHGTGLQNIKIKVYDDIESDSITYHKKVVSVDSKGNWTDVIYFGSNLEPINIEAGYHRISFKYDSLGYENSCSYYGNDGKPVIHPDKNYHKLITYHNPAGKVLSYSKYGASGLPVSVSGYHKICFEYDSLGFVTGRNWFGTNGVAVELEGIHRQSLTYDNHGNMTSLSFYDKENEPAIYSGYHKEKIWYDSLNRRVLLEYYGKSGEPINNKRGFFRWFIKYHGQNTIERLDYFYNSNGRPVIVDLAKEEF